MNTGNKFVFVYGGLGDRWFPKARYGSKEPIFWIPLSHGGCCTVDTSRHRDSSDGSVGLAHAHGAIRGVSRLRANEDLGCAQQRGW